MRALLRAIGSNDFAASSDTVVVNEDAISRSSSWSDRRLAGASSETLRLLRKAWERADGTNVRGSALARYLDGSLAAIVCCGES